MNSAEMLNSAYSEYPREYEEWIVLRNGTKVFLRPIKPTDGDLLVNLFNKLSPHSIYLRFLFYLRALPEEWVYRFTHVNYRSDFALAGVINEGAGESCIAVARYHYNPLSERTDLAIAVRDDLQNLGLGSIMLSKLVGIAIKNGILHFEGTLDLQNAISMKIFNKLGLKMKTSIKGGLCYIELDV
jgi:GNAT superfamily N-acetyltransferase